MKEDLTLEKFARSYAQRKKNPSKHNYCFILGAGASRTSGIPTGSDLAKQWLRVIGDTEAEKFDEWKKSINLEDGKEAEKYSEIYDKRFELDYREGYEFLESIMEKSSPSFGYSVLAQILDKTDDKIVITTNFDHLMEDAMQMFTVERPLVLGHESLAKYLYISSDRPIIAKIHRDLFFEPKSETKETVALEEGWKDNLTQILKYRIPIVIGYGGNDGSLMNFLENCTTPTHGMFWFYYSGGDPPNERIQKLVKQYKGRLIPNKGFDEMMLVLNDALGYKLLTEDIVTIAKERAETYKQAYEKAKSRLATMAFDNKDSATVEMLSKSSPEKETRDWWAIKLKIDKEKDIAKKDEMFQKGINETNSPELMETYALFLHDIRKDYDEAEKYYKKALEIDPNNTINNGNYALFLKNIRKDYDEAEKYYKKAIEVDPNNANNLGNYASFLHGIRKDYDEAEKYYKKVLEIDPNSANRFGNYASFLHEIRKDCDKAEQYYTKALEIDPNQANNLGNYANFLYNIREDYDKAEQYYIKAIEINPNQANNLGNYAEFLFDIRKDKDKAEKYYKKALEIDPDNEYHAKNYRQHFDK